MSAHHLRIKWARRRFGDLYNVAIEFGATSPARDHVRVFYGPNAERKAVRDRRLNA